MNILYLHGLNGSLKPKKRNILEAYGTVMRLLLIIRIILMLFYGFTILIKTKILI